MAYEINGKTLDATDTGYLVNHDECDKDVAVAIADVEGVALTQDHWDVIDYLKNEWQVADKLSRAGHQAAY